ncbi:MAG: peptide ABC transporter substrate-binding protein, partial [Ktedonobacteraceae bacterium]|nr:peptide ABC transporter substrate-binding protein [Ktedonobacteraceae bacterium]
MILTPNPYYYGKKTALAEVDMIFVNDPSTAYQFYRAGRFTFMWNIAAADLPAAKGLSGFIQTPLL